MVESVDSSESYPRSSVSTAPAALKVVGLFFGLLTLLAVGAFLMLRPRVGPPPTEIAADPQLVEGRELYLNRCASCHGETGRGDGPTARVLKDGKAGNFTDGEWRYGDTPDQIVSIIAKGTPDGQMAGWGRVFSASEVKSVAAYVFYLAGRSIPDSLRNSDSAP